MKLTLVIPCYNEEENIDKMYAAIEDAFLGKDMDLELVYVNDGSRDNTLQKLKALLSKKDFALPVVSIILAISSSLSTVGSFPSPPPTFAV